MATETQSHREEQTSARSCSRQNAIRHGAAKRRPQLGLLCRPTASNRRCALCLC